MMIPTQVLNPYREFGFYSSIFMHNYANRNLVIVIIGYSDEEGDNLDQADQDNLHLIADAIVDHQYCK